MSRWFPTTRSGRGYNRAQPHVVRDLVPAEDDQNMDDTALAAQTSDEPETYYQATRGPDRELWLDAIKEEMDALDRNNTWSVVERPDSQKLVDCRWIFKIKRGADGSIQ